MKSTPVTKFARDARMAYDGLAFLEKQLEKLDSKILEPLAATDWPRDMPVETGGGFVENIAQIDVQYGTSGQGAASMIFNEANDIPVMQADFGKETWRVFNWAHYMRISYMDRQKFQKIAYNLEEYLNKGIRLQFDKFCDENVYTGFATVNTTGLINNANVTRTTAAATGTSSGTTFASKTADQILDDINTALTAVWTRNDCASDALPNHILMPVEQFGSLVTRKVSSDSERSILTYVLENNICKQQGVDLVISPSKWCKGAGTSSSDRMVVYINDVDKVCFNQTVPLRRLTTEIGELKYKTPFLAQLSEVRFKYPTTVQYVDGI